jgi:hypothetical protein
MVLMPSSYMPMPGSWEFASFGSSRKTSSTLLIGAMAPRAPFSKRSAGMGRLDLVAWPLEAPARATSMFRRVGLLGLWWAFNKATYIFDEPLQVYKTPLDWLRAGCAGCAVVAPPLAARDLLDVPGRVAGQDVGHALQLADLLRSHVDLGSGPIKGFASLAVS